jgi:hypothetical protein
MNKGMAKAIIAHGITWGDIQDMMKHAYADGAANEKRAIVNKSFSKGTSFGILWKGVVGHPAEDTVPEGVSGWGARNCLREFGAYWTGWRPEKKKRDWPAPFHIAPEPPF